MHIKAVIFDMDGLLIDSERIALATFLQTCSDYGLPDQTSLYQSILGTNDEESLRLLDQSLHQHINSESLFNDWMSLYRRRTDLHPVPLMDGLEPLLDQLDAVGLKRAVATSTRTELAHKKLRNSKILHRFDIVIGGDQVANSKPAPDIYLKAVAAIGLQPGQCLALEDSPNGVRAAVAAGLQVIQVPDLFPPDADLRALRHTIVNSLHDVLTLLPTLQPSASCS